MSDTVTNWGVGTYAFTQLVNHLNQEKASLLEKMEHYERELQIKTTKETSRIGLEKLDERENGYSDVYNDTGYGKIIDRDFEFYYERNIRP